MSKTSKGFTLIELLIVMSIIALLMTMVGPRYFKNIEKAEITTLKQNLSTLRIAIDYYKGDYNKFPSTLEELVKKKYINHVPIDPITKSSDTWVLLKKEGENSGIYDVKSGAEGNNHEGTPYHDL